MRITYTCEVCGHQSDTKAEIEACEAIGFNPRFSIGQEIEFLTIMMGSGTSYQDVLIWMPGRVTNVFIQKETHEAVYNISTPVEFARALHSSEYKFDKAGVYAGFGSCIESKMRKPKKDFILNNFKKAVTGERGKSEERWTKRRDRNNCLVYFA